MVSNFEKITKGIGTITGNATLSALTINLADTLIVYNSHDTLPITVEVGSFGFDVLAGQRETITLKEPFTSVAVTEADGVTWIYKTEL